MGVSTILSQPSSTGRGGVSTTQQLIDLEQRVVALGGDKAGVWSVQCVTYHATSVLTNASLTKNRVLHIMNSSEDEDSSYAMTGTGLIVTGDRNLAPILSQLNTFYTQRKSMSVEAKGPRYQLGDFLIKPGIISLGPSAHSLVLEIEYQPCSVAQQCWSLVNQMLVQITDSAYTRRPLLAGHTESTLYNRSHTMLQFLQVFNDIRTSPR